MCSPPRSWKGSCAGADAARFFSSTSPSRAIFEPAINLLDDVYLYDIDDPAIDRPGGHLRERQTEIVRSVEILKPHVERYLHWASRQGDAAGLPNRMPA